MPRILAIDYGEKRIGLAMTDEGKKIAFEYDIWRTKDFWSKIADLIREKEVEKIILGYPLNMSGGQTQKTKEVLEFKDKLMQNITVPVEMFDERLTSVMATKLSGRNEAIDSLAAQIILETYLNKTNNQNS